jgi:hypothetical protein
MKLARIALRFLAVIVATSAVACGGIPEDTEAVSEPAEARQSYTEAQFQKYLTTGVQDEKVSTPSKEPEMHTEGCNGDASICCTSEGFCCWWGSSGRPICHVICC